MIIVHLSGGLGNQMFQYAMGRRLAHATQSPLKLDLSGYGEQGDTRAKGLEGFRRQVGIFKWKVTGTAATPEEIAALRDPFWRATTRDRIVRRLRRVWPGLFWPKTHTREKQYRFDSAVLSLTAPRYLDGFWQSERYFADIRSILLEEFSPKDETVLPYVKEHLAKLRALEPGPLVSLHVRRGDLAVASEQLKNVAIVHGAPVTLDYIYAAIKEFPPPCRFLVFSDSAKDVQWCRENIKADRLLFSEGHTDVQDLMLMAGCDHHITANSTFSWWAAWLNRNPARRVVTPKQWSPPGGGNFMTPEDLIPADWKML